MSMEQTEIFILNRYAASELAGALLLGGMARKVDDSFLRNKLTWHCAEEARHARIWEELISQLNMHLIAVHDSEKKGYFSYIGEAKSIIEFLAFVHVYELRVPFHFTIHKTWTSNQDVKQVLSQLIKEESSHLSWIREYFQRNMNKNKHQIIAALRKFSEIEQKTYLEDLSKLEKMGESGKKFVDLVKKSLQNYRGVLDNDWFKEDR